MGVRDRKMCFWVFGCIFVEEGVFEGVEFSEGFVRVYNEGVVRYGVFGVVMYDSYEVVGGGFGFYAGVGYFLF